MAIAPNVRHVVNSLRIARGVAIAMDEVKHDPKNGQFTAGKSEANTPEEHKATAEYHKAKVKEHIAKHGQGRSMHEPGTHHGYVGRLHASAASEHEAAAAASPNWRLSKSANERTKLANKGSKAMAKQDEMDKKK